MQELRKHRRRNTATGKTSMFSGLLYCADCSSKLYYCASKSIKDGQEFYRCSQYKENRGSCTIHFIRDSVLKELVLDTIRKVAKYFLEAIRECTDLKELTPTIVNTLIKRIEVHNSEKGEDGLKHVPVDIFLLLWG